MENQNPNLSPVLSQEEALRAYLAAEHRKRVRWFVGGLIVLIVLGFGYFGFKDADLFKAALIRTATPVGSNALFIPDYEASVGDEGQIELVARTAIGPVHSVQFTLRYDPVNALNFTENSIVFDAETVFQSADLQSVNTSVEGEATVSFFSSDAVTVAGGNILVKLNVEIDDSVPAGTEINLTAVEVEVVVPSMITTYATSDDVTGIDAGSIQVVAQNNLRMLYAESIDPTHVLVHFSDLISNPGNLGDPALPLDESYSIQGDDQPDFNLEITDIERGDAQGHGQDTVLLTTEPQIPGIDYEISVRTAASTPPASELTGLVLSNTQGGIDPDYNHALFFGFGLGGAVLSDFGMVSASVASATPRQIVVTFSEEVSAPSVEAAAFTVTNLNTAATVTLASAVASGSAVTLTVDENLLQRNTYLVEVPDRNALGAPQRQADGARLGVNQVTFTGATNGPRVLSAAFRPDPADLLDITFDSAVTAGPGGSLGTLHVSGATIGGVAVTTGAGGNATLTGAIATVTGFVSDPDTHYTFVGNTAVGFNGIPLDSASNSVGFWGSGHTETNSVGAAALNRRNEILVEPGDLDFATVTPASLDLMFYSNPLTLNPAAGSLIAGVNVDNGQLRIVTTVAPAASNDYFIRFRNPADPTEVLQVVPIGVSNDFRMESASAPNNTQVLLTFSENVDQGTVNPASFVFRQDAAISDITAIQAVVNVPNYREVRLTLSEPMASGTVYTVIANGVRSFNNGKELSLIAAVFAGYQTQAEISVIHVETVRTLSPTQVEVKFSGDVDLASMTPVNLSLIFFGAEDVLERLAVSAVQSVDARTFNLTTAQQIGDEQYFFVPRDQNFGAGARDTEGKLLNATPVLSFFGFATPQSSVSAFIPGSVINDEARTITLNGQNLNLIQTVRVGTNSVTIQSASESSLSFTLPTGFAPGTYGVTIVSQSGESRTFNNALVVTQAQQPMRVISDASLATPFRIPNNGTTQTTLRVLVEDPQDLANISSVVIDLTQMGGSPSQEMAKAAGVQPQNRQWYTFVATVPATIATSETPYQLPVQVRKGLETAEGFASVHVTRNVLGSVAPVINQAFAVPLSVPPDGVTEVRLSAQVSDPDGAETISSVIVNLAPLGLGFIPLTEVQGVGSAAETVSRYFQSEEFTVPRTTPLGSYPVTLTAQDQTGETATFSVTIAVSATLSGPTIDATRSYIAPRHSIPHDGTTAFSLSVYVNDPDGIGDIENVFADFGSLGLPPAELTRAAGVTDTARSAYFTVSDLTIPSTTSTGVRQILINVTDKSGSSANIALQVDVTSEDTLGEPPRILVDRAYTTPRVAVNDGETPLTLQVFVRDEDDDIESVLVNLAEVGQVGVAHPNNFNRVGATSSASASSTVAGAGSASPCPTASPTLVCMQPSVKEGREGQWFILPDITIRQGLAVGSEPYLVEVTAVDRTGKTSRQSIPIYVNDGERLVADAAPPAIVGAVPTSATTVEVVFSEELDPTSISTAAREFSIVDSNDINLALPLLAATINAEGTVVTLTTEPQVAGKDYVLAGTGSIRDAVGVPLVTGPSARVSFIGFEASDKPPVVEYIAASASNKIDVEFRDPLKPSTLRARNIEIKESGGTSAELKVLGIHFVEGVNGLEITTDPQKPDQRYRVSFRDIASASGVIGQTAIHKLIKGFKGSIAAAGALRATADLNSDGRVDFIDFTMFSAVYGTTLENPPAVSVPALTPAAPVPLPIPPQPNATIPVTVPVTPSSNP